MNPARFFSAVTVPLVCLVLAISAHAIVIRHDRADADYVVEESRYPQVFWLHTRYDNKVCMATLIAADWAVTAAHCLDETPIGATLADSGTWPLQVAGKPNRVNDMVVHPRYRAGDRLVGVDLALLRLETPVTTVDPVQMNRQENENSIVMSLVGWGFTGNGNRGRQGNDGRFRRAENMVEEASNWLLFRFDDPRDVHGNALELEGIPGLGDSGGPAFEESYATGTTLLAGVAVGELALNDEASSKGTYGAIEVYERISLHADWIDSVIGNPVVALTP
jgi:secreted trypsin-like serine protease